MTDAGSGAMVLDPEASVAGVHAVDGWLEPGAEQGDDVADGPHVSSRRRTWGQGGLPGSGTGPAGHLSGVLPCRGGGGITGGQGADRWVLRVAVKAWANVHTAMRRWNAVQVRTWSR